MNFSVLMSIYFKEKPTFFNQAMQSIWDNQTVKPSEIILVEDGKLTDELYQVIAQWKEKLGDVLKVVPLETNQGLAKALNAGIQHCQYDYIARMDTDDIATADRFEKQIQYFKKHPDTDILGGQIEEFYDAIGDIDSQRKLPVEHKDIVNFAKSRCPFNHPSVMYKKSAVIKAGLYQNNYLYEDYALWVRMLNSGLKAHNLPDTIVYMRTGADMFARRGGFKYAVSELKAQYQFYKIGFLSFSQFIKNAVVRFPVRVMPNGLRTFVYKTFLRQK